MFVGNPVIPVSFTLENAAGLVEQALKKKNWQNFEKGDIKLVLAPFFIFRYDAAIGEAGKPSRETRQCRLAMNGETAELAEGIAEAVPEDSSLLKELPDEYPLAVRKPIFSRKEAEKIALLKTASFLGTSRENIVLSAFREIYYPMWIVFATVAGQAYEFEISAVNGKLLGEEKVPEREKGFVELTRETLEELKEPGAWLRYSREIAAIGGEKISGKKGIEGETHAAGGRRIGGLLRKPAFWITIVLIISLAALAIYL
jgi:hypothetical protein